MPTFRDLFVTGAGVLANRDAADDIADAMRAFKGRHIDVTVEAHTDRRSDRANAYLWGVVYRELSKATGYPPEALHEAMVTLFLVSEAQALVFFNPRTGEPLEVEVDLRRSSTLGVTAFYDFVERVRTWARDWLGVETPDPDPAYWRAGVSTRV